MERWEPVSRGDERTAQAEQRRQPPQDRRDAWANACAASLGRAGIGVVFLAATLKPLPATALAGLAAALIAGLLVVCVYAWRSGLPRWGLVWINDLVSLGLLTPFLVLNGFVASEQSSLLAAERSAYGETALLAGAALLLLLLLCGWARRFLPGLTGVLYLPGALQVVALVAAFDDYRDGTVLEAVGIVYLIAAAATCAGWMWSEGRRVWLAPLAWALFFLGLMLVTPGVRPLGSRQGSILVGQTLLIGLSGAAVFGLSLLPGVSARRSFERTTSAPAPSARARSHHRRTLRRRRSIEARSASGVWDRDQPPADLFGETDQLPTIEQSG